MELDVIQYSFSLVISIFVALIVVLLYVSERKFKPHPDYVSDYSYFPKSCMGSFLCKFMFIIFNFLRFQDNGIPLIEIIKELEQVKIKKKRV